MMALILTANLLRVNSPMFFRHHLLQFELLLPTFHLLMLALQLMFYLHCLLAEQAYRLLHDHLRPKQAYLLLSYPT